MTRTEYEMLQERLSALLVREKMRDKGITGKRKEGYEEAILAAKSAVKSFFELIGKEEQSSCVSNPKGADNGPLEV